ncbi:sigma-70 family RNA polymerase sigma factor [Pseudooceanicola sp. CBS1P-1]|uniref:RNA polymerase sigma factor n=1 Tax=Pseudooceanicola albus TaxID=2692189 RepID=A0A6L7G080_9RHOB|nr:MULTISPECIES: sigma-70 family RNA polymerase sigma factor [Pseudooceanicola]MBT9382551.1 sigma-70 family RNA polymerase sigma factor [Pseudooceanicola endophyticus]MXN17092.1 sigma-70 family RNA polymerase sigma factor [Pseudooceanicola albus]
MRPVHPVPPAPLPGEADLPDGELLARIAERDEGALALLITRHGHGIRALARRYLNDAHHAEDLVQEVFLRVWTTAHSYDPDRGPGRPWLYRIATNLCTDTWRRQRLRRFFGLTPEMPEPEDEAPDALRSLAGRQELDRLKPQIAALPERQRMALMLSVAGGLANEEIAGAMGTSPGAVEQLLVRARRRLRAKLGITPEDGRKG